LNGVRFVKENLSPVRESVPGFSIFKHLNTIN
jgi:hypothetical protein